MLLLAEYWILAVWAKYQKGPKIGPNVVCAENNQNQLKWLVTGFGHFRQNKMPFSFA
jgi:hypothetical protein